MSKKEKLLKKLQSNSSFTINELDTLLVMLGYSKWNKGKTSGSAIIYKCTERAPIKLHTPHPGKELKAYQINQVINVLDKEGLL